MFTYLDYKFRRLHFDETLQIFKENALNIHKQKWSQAHKFKETQI